MERDILVALIAAAGSVFAAFVSTFRETQRSHAVGSGRTPRPFLAFASTLALLLAVTALALTVYRGWSESAAKPFVITPEMTWDQDHPAPTALGVKENEGVCFLTRVTGHFGGSVEVVQIKLLNGEYVLTGNSGQCCVQASARCIKYVTKTGNG